MSETEAVQITDASGLSFGAWLKPTDAQDLAHVLLRLADGTQFLIPREFLALERAGHYRLNVSLREYARGAAPQDAAEPAARSEPQSVISLAEETLKVGKRKVTTGSVRVIKQVVEREETVDLPLLHEEVLVERVPVNTPVEEAAPVRREGDTTIIPLYEEVLVVRKQLVLVEEVRVTRQQTVRREPQQVTLRREEAVVERGEANEAADAPSGDLEQS